jgi:asparagine synthase (glutamine-hydrolysing)
MCGICGQVNADRSHPVDRPLLERMSAAIRHRGPDSDGFYVSGAVGLAVRRLAIVDLVTGDQPISNEDKTVWIVFNGEIYNYHQLRSQLERRGHVFRTNSDTETIAHLYEDHGSECVQWLRGMFAFAVWDERQGRLLLARDRLGKKPLYYAEHAGSFLFGSELKCLLEDPTLPREVDLEAIHHYLTLQYVPDPWTAFKGIHKLPPAHRLIWQAGRTVVERYWDLAYEPKWDLDEEELKHRLRETIAEAVRIRLMSDVPLGAHLSGGIDSSIVVGLMAGNMSQPVKTFSIGFKERAFDELRYARQVADKFSTDHHEFVLEPDAIDLLPKLVQHFDEPFADPAAIPTWHLAQMTRQHVTVALNGDGGDEAFAGYRRYYADVIADAYRAVPRLLRTAVTDRLLRLLPAHAEAPMERSPITALHQLSLAADRSHAASILRWGEYFDEQQKWSLYTEEARQAVQRTPSAHLLEETYQRARARSRVDRTLYTDVHNYLPGALLTKVDRTTMAHSLEARSPFLDQEVMELAARLPVMWKVKGTCTKRILRELFADLLPEPVLARAKMGFGVPLSTWFRGPLYEPTRDLLLAPDARSARLLRRDAVTALIEQHRLGREDNGKRLWALLSLEMWLRQVVNPEVRRSRGAPTP